MSFIQAGAVVIYDVPQNAVVGGSPAKTKYWICDCRERLIFKKWAQYQKSKCRSCGKKYVMQFAISSYENK